MIPRAAEMALMLRAQTVLPKDPGSIPSTHMAAHDCLYLQFSSSRGPDTLTKTHMQANPNVHLERKRKWILPIDEKELVRKRGKLQARASQCRGRGYRQVSSLSYM